MPLKRRTKFHATNKGEGGGFRQGGFNCPAVPNKGAEQTSSTRRGMVPLVAYIIRGEGNKVMEHRKSWHMAVSSQRTEGQARKGAMT